VRLRLDDEVLELLGGSPRALAEAAIAECDKRGLRDIQELGRWQWTDWECAVAQAQEEVRDIPFPPFMPILGLYVLAVNYCGDKYAAHTYYDRLHELLGEPVHRIKSIDPSLALWLALTEWSSHLLGGRLGVFEFSILGRQMPVGFPRRQILLAPREVPALREAFIAHGILPGSTPTDARLCGRPECPAPSEPYEGPSGSMASRQRRSGVVGGDPF
jgi:hypothetical protein